MRYWPSVRSRWLDIGQVLFLRFYGPRPSRSIKTQKRTRPIPAILTEQAWSIKDLLYGFTLKLKLQKQNKTGHETALCTYQCFAPGWGGGGGGNPRAFDLVKLHSGRDFDIHNGPVGGKFDSVANFGRHPGSGEGLGMSGPPSSENTQKSFWWVPALFFARRTMAERKVRSILMLLK